MNHSRRTAAALAASTVLAVAALAACSTGPTPSTPPRPAVTTGTATVSTPASSGHASAATSAPVTTPSGSTSSAAALAVPTTLPGELARTLDGFSVVPGQTVTFSNLPEPGRDYEIRAACQPAATTGEPQMRIALHDATPTDATPGTTAGDASSALVQVSIPCDGQMHREIIGQLRTGVTADIRLPGPSARGYAIVAPGPEAVTE